MDCARFLRRNDYDSKGISGTLFLMIRRQVLLDLFLRVHAQDLVGDTLCASSCLIDRMIFLISGQDGRDHAQLVQRRGPTKQDRGERIAGHLAAHADPDVLPVRGFDDHVGSCG